MCFVSQTPFRNPMGCGPGHTTSAQGDDVLVLLAGHGHCNAQCAHTETNAWRFGMGQNWVPPTYFWRFNMVNIGFDGDYRGLINKKQGC